MTATANNEDIKTEDVQVSVKRKPACRIELDVKVSQKIVREARRSAVKTVSKEVALPGFRKGRAPEEIILKRYPNDVEKQMHKSIADIAYAEAQKLARIPLLNNNAQITFDLKNHSEESAEVVFSFETEPKIPTVDPKLFVAKTVDRPEVAEKQIEEAIRQMMFFYAEWKPVSDRPIQDGDYIMIDLDTIENGESQKVFHHIRFEVSKERMASWMKEMVKGAKAGDVLEGMSEADDTATEEEKKEFKPKQVRLSVLKVEEAILPELNDEFAKKVGAENVQVMRESITKMLNDRADEKVKESLYDQVNDFITEQYAFDLPTSLVETEKKHRKQQLMQDPKFKANWEKMSQEEREKVEEKLSIESAQAVRLFYLSRGVVQQANLPITHKEIQDEAISTMHSFGHRNIQADRIPREVFALALSKVILAKAQEYILEQAKPK
ncbi:MAG: trigger factor [Verrucomicrobia bacterium]|nr:trigger factor [Verrucomicrobiota bacterium]